METFVVQEVVELEAVAARVLERLKGAERENKAAVLALHGDLGSGKATFTQLLSRQLGVTEIVVSPTFVVMKHYELPEETEHFTNLYHLDAYRIESNDELRPLRFEALLAEPGALIVIEWAELIEALLPAYTLHLTFTQSGDERTLTIS